MITVSAPLDSPQSCDQGIHATERFHVATNCGTLVLDNATGAPPESGVHRIRSTPDDSNYVSHVGAPSVENQLEPRFSVVIPTHGRPLGLERALSSLHAQSRRPLEVIVIDDAGHPPAVVQDDGLTRLIRCARNGGAGAARNLGIAAAAGDWVVFLDDDDALLPTFLEKVRNVIMERPDVDIVATDVIVDDGGIERRLSDERPFAHSEQLEAMVRRPFFSIMTAVRRSSLLKVNGFAEDLEELEDMDLWIRLFASGSRAAFIDEPLARYQRGSGKSSDANRMSRVRIEVLRRALVLELSAPQRTLVEERLRLAEQGARTRQILKRFLEGAPTPAMAREIAAESDLPPRTRLVLLAGCASPRLRSRLVAKWRL